MSATIMAKTLHTLSYEGEVNKKMQGDQANN
jgi:hypothetical protein